jgi:uncharacterized membrane protein YeaQ/YmgE (transglycosylase-associated protein family)
MGLFGFLLLLIIASIVGSIGSRLAGHSTQGCLTSIALGFIGALIGTWLSIELKIPDFLYYHDIPIFWSIVGSALFVAVIGLLMGGRGKRRS